MNDRPITLSSADVGELEMEMVARVLESRVLSNGDVLRKFEQEFAERLGVPHAVGVSSGTAGLHLGMIAADVGDADFVITPTFSFVASANVILYERAIPIFVDCDPETLNLDVEQTISVIKRLADSKNRGALLPRSVGASSGRLRAIIPVHVFGRPLEMDALKAAAEFHGISIVEDACEALGSSIHGVPAGTAGHASVFGFFPNKQLTTGEGGMFVTASSEWATLARSLRNQGRDSDQSWLRYSRVGFNYRMTEMSAALGRAQLRRLDSILLRRRQVAEWYDELLATVAGASMLARPAEGHEVAWFVQAARLDEEIDRDLLMSRMAERGVETRPYFWPIHLQEYYRQTFGFREGDFPHAEAAGHALIALPFSSTMTREDVQQVCDVMAEEIQASRRLSRDRAVAAR
jgi:dTDP-4-amino-4,6-dideoxygalactose transaminase